MSAKKDVCASIEGNPSKDLVDNLCFLYDNQETPKEVTVFEPGSDRLTTEWLTADVETTVELDDVV